MTLVCKALSLFLEPLRHHLQFSTDLAETADRMLVVSRTRNICILADEIDMLGRRDTECCGVRHLRCVRGVVLLSVVLGLSREVMPAALTTVTRLQLPEPDMQLTLTGW